MFFLFWIVAELLFGEGVKVFGGAAGSGCDLMAESRPVIENLGGSGEFVLDICVVVAGWGCEGGETEEKEDCIFEEDHNNNVV